MFEEDWNYRFIDSNTFTYFAPKHKMGNPFHSEKKITLKEKEIFTEEDFYKKTIDSTLEYLLSRQYNYFRSKEIKNPWSNELVTYHYKNTNLF